MNRCLAFLLLISPIVGLAQTPSIKSGATVYIEAADGYETYLAAAIVKQHVPLVIVTDRDKADYIVRSSQILFAYSPRNDSLSGTAEACAKHLKEFVAKHKK